MQIWYKDKIDNALACEAIDALNELAALCEVRVRWIKAHKGYEGNERADKLAKAATYRHCNTSIPPSKETMKSHIKARILEDWEREWVNTGPWRTKVWFPRPCLKTSKELLSLPRSMLSRMVQTITGHDHLKAFQHKLGRTQDPTCRVCMEPGSVENLIHLVCECPALIRRRAEYFLDYLLDPKDPKWTVEKLSKFLTEVPVARLFSTYIPSPLDSGQSPKTGPPTNVVRASPTPGAPSRRD